MKHLISITLLLSLLLTACGASAAPATVPASEAPNLAPTAVPQTAALTVFAAASLTDAFSEIGTAFEAANPGVKVTFNFGSSQTLRTQIEEGAPVDVFASANTKEMDALGTANFIAQDIPQFFLTNKLVVILPTDNRAGITTLEDLAKPGIKLVLAAEEVPVGKYSREAFDKMNASFSPDFKDKILANVVSNEENVKQVVAKVQLGEADAGIVYTSDAVAAPELKTIEIATDVNVVAKYPIAPLIESANSELAAQFVEYVLSLEGQTVLKKWGFGPIQ
jgi:molybdate transport system substrate-binding protein